MNSSRRTLESRDLSRRLNSPSTLSCHSHIILSPSFFSPVRFWFSESVGRVSCQSTFGLRNLLNQLRLSRRSSRASRVSAISDDSHVAKDSSGYRAEPAERVAPSRWSVGDCVRHGSPPGVSGVGRPSVGSAPRRATSLRLHVEHRIPTLWVCQGFDSRWTPAASS